MLGRCIRPLATRPQLASSPLQAQCRFASAHVRVSVGSDLGPTREDGHQTLRIRKEQRGKDLPLPPLLDPVALEERSRWEKTKAQPKAANLTSFQKKLQANAYAHALASPVRQCRATQISLPEAFLTTLHARPHPTTNDPWLLPVSLTKDKSHLGPPYRFISRREVARHLSKKKLWERGIYSRMVEKYGGAHVKKMVWREDLPDLILGLMQKQLVKKLSWNFARTGRLSPVASPRSEDIGSIEGASCVLIFRSLKTRADDIEDRAKAIIAELDKWSAYVAKSFAEMDPHNPPHVTHKSPSWFVEPLVPRLQPRLRFPVLDYKTTVWRGKKIPIYSLTDLLGEERARDLIGNSKYGGDKCVVTKEARHNVPVELLLLRLQAYIAQSGS
ncbi:hypothetical protein EK21DRAFT_59035 [Setomelanomma holmii]|uniref:Uncharacterized protein n=1 Tax=Setomelanomma holmii TaxID=210430 RepID=A0A9P4LMZ8_9PLEO|nr:hypothetical protein EK21DRAFT_59035 [Setomelanomma holmii]